MPFAFIFLIASKTVTQANLLQFSWPQPFALLDNLAAGRPGPRLPDGHRLHQQHHPHRRQRRRSGHPRAPWSPTSGSAAGGRLGPVVNILVLAGLIVPPAVVPTIWVLQKVGLFKTMPGLILIEIAYGLPFCILLFRAFMPRSRGNWTRRPSSTAPARCRSSSG